MRYERIRLLREEHEYSQEDVGRRIGIPQRTYSHYETGSRMITPDVLKSLALLYNTSIDYILELTDVIEPPARKGNKKKSFPRS